MAWMELMENGGGGAETPLNQTLQLYTHTHIQTHTQTHRKAFANCTLLVEGNGMSLIQLA